MNAMTGLLGRGKPKSNEADLAAVFATQTALIAVVETLSDDRSLTWDRLLGRLRSILAAHGSFGETSAASAPIRQLIYILERDQSPLPGLQQYPSRY